MALCSGLSFFVLCHSYTLFGKCVYHHGTMCRIHSWTLYDLGLWPQYQNYIFTMVLSLARSSLFFNKGIPNFGIWMYHHETILTLVWPWLWPICGWQGFYSQFLSCFTLASKKLGCIVLARPVIPSSTKIFFIFFWELLMTATWCFLQPQLGVLHCPYRFHTCLASVSFLPLYSKDLSNWK